MTDFSMYHTGDWRDGEIPKVNTSIVVVNYDTRNRAYAVPKDELDEFSEWVAQKWEIDRDPREEDEEAGDYLDRIGVSIRDL